MALVKTYTLVCDVCGRRGADSWEDAAESARQRKAASAHGWVREAGCDICPGCRAKGWAANTAWPDGNPHRLRKIVSAS